MKNTCDGRNTTFFSKVLNVESVASLFVFNLIIKNMLKELCTCTNVICIFNLYMLTFEFVPTEPHKKLELGACQAGIFYLSLQHMQQGFRKDSCT